MKNVFPIFLLASLLFFEGCYSFEIATSDVTGERHAIAMNYGWLLFNRVPLVCGNTAPKEERVSPWTWFRDDVTFEKTQHRFMEEVGTMNGEIVDLSFWVRENFLYEVPYLEVPLPLPYVLTYREIQLSGTLK